MLEALLGLLREHCAQLPDCRQASPNLTYTVSAAALGAFALCRAHLRACRRMPAAQGCGVFHAITLRLPAQRTTILADDLQGHQPLCELLRDCQFNFSLVCKPESHETLYRELDLLARHGLLETHSERVWNGRLYERRDYRFTKHVPLRAGVDALAVSWCDVSSWHTQTGEQLYYNAFATNFQLTAANVAEVVRSGRARWKTENENHNTLKNRGYHLEHNFGHGQQYLSALLVTLKLLAFLCHSLLWLSEPIVQQIRTRLGTLTTVWDDVRTLTRYFCCQLWQHLWQFMLTQLELAASP